jgi:sugar transferase (PEP-CTERM/EpsH1 system associated)
VSDSRPLIVHVVFRFDYGGLENGIVNVVNGLAGGKFRHAIVALTESTDFSRRLHGDVAVYALHKRPGKDPATYWRLFRLLRKLRPFAVHTRNFGTLDCAVVAFLAGVPIRIHGEHGWDVFDPDGARRKYRLLRQVFGRFVHVFVTVSDDLRRWLVERVGIPAGRVRRIHNGVDTERFRPSDPGEPRPLPPEIFAPGTLVVGSVTRFAAIKDPLNLVEAFIRARAHSAPEADALRLLMVGDGDLRATALARLEAAGLAPACWLPGSRDDVPALLRSMDVFVLGSLREGISNTVLEAMASGVPVIATNTGGNTELVTAATGQLVPVADPAALATAMVDYARDAALRSRLGRQARERAVQEFSIAAMLANYRALYDYTLAMAGI